MYNYSYAKRFPLIFAVTLLVCLSGCIPDQVSWSPDGKRLSFLTGEDPRDLWVWDTSTEKARRLTGDGKHIGDNVLSATFLSSGTRMLLVVGDAEHPSLWILDEDSSRTYKIDDEVSLYYGHSADGNLIYYVVEKSLKKTFETRQTEWEDRHVLVEYDVEKKKSKDLFNAGFEFGFPTPDAACSRIILSGEKGPMLLEKGRHTAQSLMESFDPEKTAAWWPTWIDDKTILLALVHDDREDGFGELVRYSLSDRSKTVLCDNVYGWLAPSLSPDKKTVIVSYSPEEDDKSLQLASVDIDTGKRKLLTDEAGGAGFAAFSPDGSNVAYISPPEIDADGTVVNILEIGTGKRNRVRGND